MALGRTRGGYGRLADKVEETLKALGEQLLPPSAGKGRFASGGDGDAGEDLVAPHFHHDEGVAVSPRGATVAEAGAAEGALCADVPVEGVEVEAVGTINAPLNASKGIERGVEGVAEWGIVLDGGVDEFGVGKICIEAFDAVIPELGFDATEAALDPFGGDEGVDERKLHGSGDALSTGAVKSETGLATSADGVRWKWEGRVFAAAAKGWDKATTRLTTAFRGDDGWVGLYDGAADISENYEERCGMARSTDLRTWERMGSEPAIGAAGGAGTVRYVESVVFGERLLFFFERTRADGAHELCMSSAPVSGSGRGSPG